MRKITNSAGLAGAMPMRQISRSLSMSFWVVVGRLHRYEERLLQRCRGAARLARRHQVKTSDLHLPPRTFGRCLESTEFERRLNVGRRMTCCGCSGRELRVRLG